MENCKFKVGQKVKLVDRYLSGEIAHGFVENMRRHLGEVVTISGVHYDEYSGHYFVVVEENIWSWDVRFLEEVEKAVVYSSWDFINEDSILPSRVFTEKIIHNGRAVIVIAKHRQTGKIYKAVSKCQDGDTFDLKAGVRLGMYKILRKIADEGIRKFI